MIDSQSNHDIVHLVASPSEHEASFSYGRTIPVMLCAHALEHKLTPPGRVILIGESSTQRQADLLALQWDKRLAPPLGKPGLLKRRIKALTRNATRVICWNDELADLLNGLDAECDLISTSPGSAPDHISKRVSIRCLERTDRDLWIDRGHSASIDTLLPSSLDNIGATHRTISRSAIGIDAECLCIGVLADRPSDIDAREIAFLMGLLNAAGYTLSGVVPKASSHLTAARRHHRGLGSRFKFFITSDPITTLLPIFDLLIHPNYDGSGASMLIERMCENAEVPVLRLKHSGRAGLSRAPGVAGPIIEYLDEILRSKHSSTTEPVHA